MLGITSTHCCVQDNNFNPAEAYNKKLIEYVVGEIADARAFAYVLNKYKVGVFLSKAGANGKHYDVYDNQRYYP